MSADRLAELLDREEIGRALVRYCRGIDRLDEDLVRSVYHPDAIDDHGSFKGSGWDFAAAVVPKLRERFSATQHTIGNVTIELDGDVARVESYVVAHHVRRGDPASPVLDVFGGRYVDRFERREGGPWLIAERTVVHDWSRVDRPGPWEGDTTLFEPGRRDRDDASYAR